MQIFNRKNETADFFFIFFFPKLVTKHKNVLQAGSHFIHGSPGLLS